LNLRVPDFSRRAKDWAFDLRLPTASSEKIQQVNDLTETSFFWRTVETIPRWHPRILFPAQFEPHLQATNGVENPIQ
jgi:hypothetical protein